MQRSWGSRGKSFLEPEQYPRLPHLHPPEQMEGQSGTSGLTSLPPTCSATPDPLFGTNNSFKPKQQKGKIPYLETLSLSQENIFLHVEDKEDCNESPARISVGSEFAPFCLPGCRSLIRFFENMAFEAPRQKCTNSGPSRMDKTFLNKNKGSHYKQSK